MSYEPGAGFAGFLPLTVRVLFRCSYETQVADVLFFVSIMKLPLHP